MLTYAQKREKNLCTRAHCGKRSGDFTKCAGHRRRDREIQTKRSAVAKACGLCSRCKIRPAAAGYRRCEPCANPRVVVALPAIPVKQNIDPLPSASHHNCRGCGTRVTDRCDQCARCTWAANMATWRANRRVAVMTSTVNPPQLLPVSEQ